MWTAACGDDTAPPAADAAGDGTTATDGTAADARRETGPTGDGTVMMGDGGLPAPPTGCLSAADCTDAGPGAHCCYSMMNMAIACIPAGGPCDFRQCQVCDNECQAGYSCIASPFGGKVRYCAMSDGGGGSDGSGSCGPGDAGVDGSDGGDSSRPADTGSDVESGPAEAAVDAGTDTAADAMADSATDAMTSDAHD
jgi:hypothetical protein